MTTTHRRFGSELRLVDRLGSIVRLRFHFPSSAWSQAVHAGAMALCVPFAVTPVIWGWDIIWPYATDPCAPPQPKPVGPKANEECLENEANLPDVHVVTIWVMKLAWRWVHSHTRRWAIRPNAHWAGARRPWPSLHVSHRPRRRDTRDTGRDMRRHTDSDTRRRPSN